MLDIKTFDARQGGNVLYKAFAHPLAAEAIARLAAGLRGPLAVYDPDGVADALFALHPEMPPPDAVYVHDTEQIGLPRAGRRALPLVELLEFAVGTVLVASFDAAKLRARISPLLAPGVALASLDEARLPAELLTNPRRYLDPLNFATNYAFFRDAQGLSTRLVTANYWASYGAASVRLWLRLFGEAGDVLAEWEQPLPAGPGGVVIDSAEIRARFGLPAFCGQLFLHAIGIAGHDVVKYALDTYGTDCEPSLSCTHDANAWPSDRYAGLPAPREGERVVLWVQNSHAAPIPAGTLALDRMGAEEPVALAQEVPPFATVALDVDALLPGLRWPAQVELRAGRHMVRPRYEVVQNGRTRIAHVNVERADLRPDPGIPALSNLLGRGYLLPFPVLPPDRFATVVQPTPMAETQADLPVRVDVFAPDGRLVAERFLGRLPRNHDIAFDLAELATQGGHAELVYDFRDGGSADGWLHCLVRYEDRRSGHAAETSFGSHIFNTLMTYKGEPQSYNGPPPGLSTRLFLKLGEGNRRSFAHLIYPASAAWHPFSTTSLELHDSEGAVIAEETIAIACSGSAMVWPHEVFGPAVLQRAGLGGYVLVDDRTCRLFGYHGLMDDRGGFSLDHMFGF
jgi:hypothetical protein